MSWFDRSVFGVSLFGACVFSASLAWANPSENMKVKKIIYTEEMLQSSVPEGLSRIRSSISTVSFSSGERYFPVLLVSTHSVKMMGNSLICHVRLRTGFSLRKMSCPT